MRIHKLIFLFFIFLFSLTQGAGWVTVTGEAYLENKTPEEARKEALKDARQKAIAKVVGIAIKSQQLDLQSAGIDAFSSLSQSTTWGKIVKEKKPKWNIETLQLSIDKPPAILYKVTLKAKVKKETGNPDPEFKLSVRLNNETFREGEEMIIKIKCSQDAHITVFNILSNDTVAMLFPNQYMEDNFVQADKIYEIPSKEWRERGIHFRLGLPPERDNIQEMIMVIATKEDIPFESRELREWGAGILPSYQDAITRLNQWLLSIPIDKRTSELSIYQVQKN